MNQHATPMTKSDLLCPNSYNAGPSSTYLHPSVITDLIKWLQNLMQPSSVMDIY